MNRVISSASLIKSNIAQAQPANNRMIFARRLSIALTLCLFLGLLSRSADAKYPPDGNGVAGRILSVSDRYFMFDSNYGVIKVFVSANTHFQDHGRPSTPDQIKEGVAVRVTAHVTADHIWECYKINLTDK